MGRVILVTGGTRSGKSAYAQDYAETLPAPRYFVATCPVIDPEMDDRIRRHKRLRQNGGWRTIEEEIDLEGVFDKMENAGVCLVDCLTLWVNNLLFRAEREHTGMTEEILLAHCAAFLAQARRFTGTTICVTGEVGMGIVPENAAARLYRDLVGCCNQAVARAADEVVLVSCGIPLVLKR